jgi:DNA-binding NarL/FixJ family response regulator
VTKRSRPVKGYSKGAGHLSLHRDLVSDEIAVQVSRAMGRLTYITQRQEEVLLLIAAGATNSQIHRRLGIAEATVENHIKELKYRLWVESRAFLAIVGYLHLMESSVLSEEEAVLAGADTEES